MPTLHDPRPFPAAIHAPVPAPAPARGARALLAALALMMAAACESDPEVGGECTYEQAETYTAVVTSIEAAPPHTDCGDPSYVRVDVFDDDGELVEADVDVFRVVSTAWLADEQIDIGTELSVGLFENTVGACTPEELRLLDVDPNEPAAQCGYAEG